MVLILTEGAAGYGLFRLKNKALLEGDKASIHEAFKTPESINKHASLEAFCGFKDTKTALDESSALIESKMGKQLKKFLSKNIVDKSIKDELAVIDSKLASVIKEKLGIQIAMTEQTKELQRALRFNVSTLLEEFTDEQSKKMQVSLAHAMSRFKLKFSPDKVDTMIIQAIGLLDDLDKELNNFSMRLREWYGWHFPEMSKILTDGLVYAKAIQLMGFRSNCKSTDFSTIGVPEDMAEELKRAAETSHGTPITAEDLEHINCLAARVMQLLEYRQELATYLKARMAAIAPNLSFLVGDLIGARLISHAGSLMNLAKHPASTIQVLGAEKAVFRAMKTKTNTPKYGLLYHANLVGKSHSKFKGKISRVLAAKLALSCRVDALGEDSEPTVARAFKDYIEKKMIACEEGDDIAASRKHLKGSADLVAAEARKVGTASGSNTYNTDADAVPEKEAEKDGEKDGEKKKKKKRSSKEEEPVVEEVLAVEEPAKKKKKKKSKIDTALAVEA